MAKQSAKSKRPTTTTPKATPEPSTAVTTSRARRSPEELIADLKSRIKEVQQKAAAKELKKSDSIRRTLGIVRSLGKALDEAEAEGNNPLRHALADAHRPIAHYLEKQGMRVPRPRLPRGRKPRG